jgi:rSAM/selenodomain-associated transferase 1
MNATGAPAVLVMAKAPRPGTVKTRLHPLLGPAGCAALQAELIRHTLEVASAAGPRVHLAYAPADAEANLRDLAPPGVRMLPQHGRNLGQRMAAAALDVFSAGAGRLLVIGTDAPTLTGRALAAALTALADHDAVLGPAFDGGYYLIGMHAPRTDLFAIDPALWSTDQVLSATLTRARALHLTVELLAPLRDLDTPEDAAVLLEEPGLPPGIAAVLRTGKREPV